MIFREIVFFKYLLSGGRLQGGIAEPPFGISFYNKLNGTVAKIANTIKKND